MGEIQLSDVCEDLIYLKHRYKVLYGGRGSGKSYAMADSLIICSLMNDELILCGREYQNSIKDSVHQLLSKRIEELGFSDNFLITRDEIRSKINKSKFIFKGLAINAASIKSTTGITKCFVEEAETISKETIRLLFPTIREEGSEIWICFNPKNKKDPVYNEFIEGQPPENAYIKKLNYYDNPFFTKELEAERCQDLKRYSIDYEVYKHIWEGECLTISDSLVFKDKFEVSYFSVDYTFGEPLHGMDFGFSKDPTTLVRIYVRNNILYIFKEIYEIGLEIDRIASTAMNKIDKVEDYVIRADSSRPDTISFLAKHGLSFIEGAKKGKGSVEDGVAFMKSFEKIVIHPECKNSIDEFMSYSYKVDRRTDDILPKFEDKDNHIIDAIRYALEPMMKNNYYSIEDIL